MQVKLKFGIDKLLFGMKQEDVKKLYGEPDKHFKDEDKNIIFAYNQLQLRLTFYDDEDLRLGYMISSNPRLTINDRVVINETVDPAFSNIIQIEFIEFKIDRKFL